MVSVISISLGELNGQKANAPPRSKQQHNIILNMSDGSPLPCGSGWGVWDSEGSHYHLGGDRSAGGRPTIYRLRTKIEEDKLKKNGDVCGPGWTKSEYQEHALKLYELLGKQ